MLKANWQLSPHVKTVFGSYVLALLCIGAVPTPVLAQGGSPCAPVEQGGEMAYNSGGVSAIDAALFADGSGIVVFVARNSSNSDGSNDGIFGQRIDANGNAEGQPFAINTITEGSQSQVAVAAAPSGRFVAVWSSDVSPGDDEGTSIRGRAYRPNGTPIGPDFQVNSSPFGPQRTPDVGMADDGSFVAVWYDDSDAPGSSQKNGREVRARRFRTDATAVGPDFVVNNRTNGTQDEPAVAMGPDGRFVIVFSSSSDSPGNDTGRSIQARVYGANGAPQAGQFQVNTTIEERQAQPAVAMDPDGSFLVVWESLSSPGTDQDGSSIQARGYTRTGAAVGPQRQVNQVVERNQFEPEVAAAGGREFLVVWNSRALDDRVKARAITLETELLGTEYRAGGFSEDRTTDPAVAGNGAGRTITLYERASQIRGQVYQLPCVTGGGATDCTETATNLCLTRDRFKVSVIWRDVQGDTGQGQAIELTPDTGYFWFFDSANVETVVKVLDACVLNDRFWVFIGGLTDLNIEFVIEDVQNGVIRTYENPLQTSFQTVNDTNAFATCP